MTADTTGLFRNVDFLLPEAAKLIAPPILPSHVL